MDSLPPALKRFIIQLIKLIQKETVAKCEWYCGTDNKYNYRSEKKKTMQTRKGNY